MLVHKKASILEHNPDNVCDKLHAMLLILEIYVDCRVSSQIFKNLYPAKSF